jgi:hypothetical protein
MWPKTFSARLESWNNLRIECQTLDKESVLKSINAWWFCTPWRPYYLHWDDQTAWTDPWQLLSDDIYCEVARGLGILYTITLLERADLAPVDLVLTTSGHNLVLVQKTKYILNWDSNSIVNNNLEYQIHKQYRQQQIA